MLGYVKAFKPEMKMKDYELYRGIYCSLCRALGRNYSPLAQLFLSYDFTLAAIIRLAASNELCTFAQKRCPYNPAKKCMICDRKAELDLCAHAVIITVFYKILDDLSDNGIRHRLRAALVYPVIALMHKKAARLAPQIEKAVCDAMKIQKQAEEKPNTGIDEAAHGSALALGNVFKTGFEGKTADSLYSVGYMVGRFVYILDAADDLDDDMKKENFNPFKGRDVSTQEKREAFADEIRGMLNLTQSACLDALDSLEKKRFEYILENIIFDGLTACMETVLSKYGVPEEKKKTYTV